MSEAKFDPHRRLCPDGACVGVIGDDGRCRVCGRNASGGAAPEGFVSAADADFAADADTGADPGEASAGKTAGPGKSAAFDPKRRLCPDGDCLGVIGADGVCNVCGKTAEG